MEHHLTTEQLLARARRAYGTGAYDEAVEDLYAVLSEAEGFADVYNLLGVCHGLAGRPESALAAFDRAVELNDRYVEALLNRGITLSLLGRTEEARESFVNAAEADEAGGERYPATVASQLANAHHRLGDMYAEAGDLGAAIGEYRRAVELRPQFVDIRNKLGRTLIDAGRTGEAEEELRQILRANPVYTSARANLGLALFRLGRVDEAEREWRQCRTQSDDPQVDAYLQMLRRRGGE
jgi:tetratricopeptide (TPR) repeat protein